MGKLINLDTMKNSIQKLKEYIDIKDLELNNIITNFATEEDIKQILLVNMNRNKNIYVFNMDEPDDLTIDFSPVYKNKSMGEVVTDWGDGVVNTEMSHTYAEVGEYTVITKYILVQTTTGYIPYLVTSSYQSLIKCLNIDNTLEDCSGMFANCKLLQQAPVIPDSVTNCKKMFDGCTSLTTLPQENIDLMQAVKDGTNTTLTSYSDCYRDCTNIKAPLTYEEISSQYPTWV